MRAVIHAVVRDEPRHGGVDVSEWQTMETAPLDGTSVLVYYLYPGDYDWSIDNAFYRDGMWICGTQWIEAKPTHWMPLPAPPDDA